MCCKVEEYKPYLELFEKVQLDSVHFDIMDGAYVKNVMLGTPIYKDIKRLSKLPVDVHIMSYRPEEYMEYYDIQPGDRISFHPETTAQPYKLLQTIRDKGCKAGLVLNPGTPVSYLETVNPGFAGQKMVPDAPQKIRRVRQLLDAYEKEIDIVVDGNTTIENSRLMRDAGANAFVVGTSSIIRSLDTFEEMYNAYVQELEK